MAFLTKFLSDLFGSKADRDRKELTPYVVKINEIYQKIVYLSNDELRQLTWNLQAKIKDSIKEDQEEIATMRATVEDIEYTEREKVWDAIDKIEKEIDAKIAETLNEILPEAFAIMKDTARRFKEHKELVVNATQFDRDLSIRKENVQIDGDRAIYSSTWLAGGNPTTWDMVHYDVQLMGGVVLHKGAVAEMATGEGKTLVATLPVFLNALSGRGVHLVTVNDYLAKRDSEWMGPLYEFHNLSVDCIDRHQPNSDARRKAYEADITFGTNNEFGFDYLRDNMSVRPSDLVQRIHNFAIVDEVDSVLIDEARTPLIISGPIPKGDDQLFDELKPKVITLVSQQKQLVSQLLLDARKLIKEGNSNEGSKLLLRAYKGLPKLKILIKFLSEPGIKTMMMKTEDTYLAENSKRMPEITDDLYFVIDERNNSVDMTDKGIDLITGNSDDARFFILPDIGSEIADIEKNIHDAEEKIIHKDQLLSDYAVKSERVHTIQQLLKAYALFEKDVEYVVMENQVRIVDEQTGRILEGRRYSDGLHQAIEAKENVKIEAATQTFATVTLQNFFRMYKKLSGMTGTAETEAGEFWNIYKLDVVVVPTNVKAIRKDMEDLVYKTKREKYNAVIEDIVRLVELGRPILVGTTSVEVSELLSRMLTLRKIKHNVLNAKLHQKEADIVAEAGRRGTVTIATNMAGRGTDIKLSQEVRDCGGLAIIGTERHDSRRVDRQLRGRAGRQGDPGSSQFFVCLEDELMRLFGSDRISRIMDRLGLKEGEVIQHSLISKSIEKAQKKVEENNFGIRKRLLEYDDVMNSQREVIYKRRRHALFGERLEVDITNMIWDVCESVVAENSKDLDYKKFSLDVIRVFAIESPIDESKYLKNSVAEITQSLYDAAMANYKRKTDAILSAVKPEIRNVFENKSHLYENIVIPITDGLKEYPIVANLKVAYQSQGKEIIRSYEKYMMLATIDEYWKEHLREMDELKNSVQNAAYEQKDPLLIYKFESYELFRNMIDTVNKEINSVLMRGHIPKREAPEVKQVQQDRKKQDFSKYQTTKDEVEQFNRANAPKEIERGKPQPIKVDKKIGRNDQCPCGSGKKFKNCHGRDEAVTL